MILVPENVSNLQYYLPEIPALFHVTLGGRFFEWEDAINNGAKLSVYDEAQHLEQALLSVQV